MFSSLFDRIAPFDPPEDGAEDYVLTLDRLDDRLTRLEIVGIQAMPTRRRDMDGVFHGVRIDTSEGPYQARLARHVEHIPSMEDIARIQQECRNRLPETAKIRATWR